MELLIVLGAIAGAIGSLGIIWHKGVKPAYRFCKRLVRVVDVVADLPEWQYTVGLTLLELHPDHGTTMKDKVDKLSVDVPVIHEMIENHIQDQTIHRSSN